MTGKQGLISLPQLPHGTSWLSWEAQGWTGPWPHLCPRGVAPLCPWGALLTLREHTGRCTCVLGEAPRGHRTRAAGGRSVCAVSRPGWAGRGGCCVPFLGSPETHGARGAVTLSPQGASLPGGSPCPRRLPCLGSGRVGATRAAFRNFSVCQVGART